MSLGLDGIPGGGRSNILSSLISPPTPAPGAATSNTHHPGGGIPNQFRFPSFPLNESIKFTRGLRNSLGFPGPLPVPIQGNVVPDSGRNNLGGHEERPDSSQTKQKTYPCPQCGKIFNAHYNLTRHMPVHTGK